MKNHVVLTAGLLLLCASGFAGARGGGDQFGSVSFQPEYGFSDGYNFGMGLRAGALLPSRSSLGHFYVGGRFDWFAGTVVSAWVTQFNYFGSTVIRVEHGDLRLRSLFVGGEAGYEMRIPGGIAFRPYLGMGLANVSYSEFSSSKFALWPGVQGSFDIDRYFVGMDFNYRIVDQFGGTVAGAFAGLRF